MFDKTNWHEALDQYYKASELKPEEPYPHEKINAINLILFKNLDEEYQSAIQLGDELLSQNNLEQALDHFKKKPSNLNRIRFTRKPKSKR